MRANFQNENLCVLKKKNVLIGNERRFDEIWHFWSDFLMMFTNLCIFKFVVVIVETLCLCRCILKKRKKAILHSSALKVDLSFRVIF